MSEVEYEGKQYAGTYVISTKEEAENRGSAAKFDLDKGKAENLRKSTGNMRAHCVAAAAVEINNGGRGGKKLADWWS